MHYLSIFMKNITSLITNYNSQTSTYTTMKKVLPLLLLAFTITLSSCEKDEEVLPLETEVSSVDQSIDFLAPSRPRPTRSVDQSIDFLAPSRPRPTRSVDQSIDFLAPSRPRPTR